MTLVILLIALVIILIGAESFTNALEHLGERLKISEGVTLDFRRGRHRPA